MKTHTISFRFRWNVELFDDNEVVVHIPMEAGPPVLDPKFADSQNLSRAEYLKAEAAVLEAIAIIR